MKKRFSMRNKLLIIFGLLVALATITEGLLAIRTARKAVIEKIETHLTDKATDTAEIIDRRVTAFGSTLRVSPRCRYYGVTKHRMWKRRYY